MPKVDRAALHAMFGGRCAYCGDAITLKQMQADHIVPKMRGYSDRSLEAYSQVRGQDSAGNLFPSCAPCNRLKSALSLEEFRGQVDWNMEALRKYDCQYRHLLRFKRITETAEPVVFYFEACATPKTGGTE